MKGAILPISQIFPSSLLCFYHQYHLHKYFLRHLYILSTVALCGHKEKYNGSLIIKKLSSLMPSLKPIHPWHLADNTSTLLPRQEFKNSVHKIAALFNQHFRGGEKKKCKTFWVCAWWVSLSEVILKTQCYQTIWQKIHSFIYPQREVKKKVCYSFHHFLPRKMWE